jgi:hypothetical protein
MKFDCLYQLSYTVKDIINYIYNMEKFVLRSNITEKDRAEQDRLIAAFEKNRCPSCGKDIGLLGIEDWDGFCSETCFQEYEKIDPNLSNLTEAGGEFDYRKSLAKDAEELGMDVNEYRKLREEKKLSFAEIRDGIRTEEQREKVA